MRSIYEQDVKQISDSELRQLFNDCAGAMSFYNAAEGSNYSEERTKRENCEKRLDEVETELKERSLEYSKAGFLL